MAENPEQPSQKAISSTFPMPPPFWKQFTSDNLARVQELRAAQAEKEGVALKELGPRLTEIPEPLRNLQPPAEPPTGSWKVLGGQYSLDDKLPSLEETEIQRLAPAQPEERDGKHLDRAFELKKMAKSLLLNFLELVGMMSITPEESTEKIDHLRTLLINFHHVLNEYRPHQARESAIALMQSHLDRTRDETAAIRAQVDKAKRVLEGLGSMEIPSAEPVAEEATDTAKSAGAKSLEREAGVWKSANMAFLS